MNSLTEPNNSVFVSAPGKLMLFGEHSVVYNRPCIVTAVNQRIWMTLSPLPHKELVIEAPDVRVTGYVKPLSVIGGGDVPKGVRFVEHALNNFLKKYPVDFGVRIDTVSDFSAEYGFGSSSASAVCTVKAMSAAAGVNLTPKQIFDLSYQTVLDIQKKGSGFDTAAAVYGGTIYFLTGGKQIKPVTGEQIPLVVGYSGVKADTSKLIAEVAEKRKQYPEKVERIFDAITEIVGQAKEKIIASDWERVGKLMDFNQEYLRNLGVSTDILEAMISAAKKAGAYGAKLSGAGGGDSMIAVCPPDKIPQVRQAIEAAGGMVVDAVSGAEGVKLEERLKPGENET